MKSLSVWSPNEIKNEAKHELRKCKITCNTLRLWTMQTNKNFILGSSIIKNFLYDIGTAL